MSTAAVEPTSEMLTLDRIKAWAASKAPDAVVGTPCRTDKCPVACYLREQGPWYVAVGSEVVEGEIDGVVGSMELPGPIELLINQVDDTSAANTVTAADLLAIIADLEQRP